MKKYRKASLILTLLTFTLQALSCGGSGTSIDTAADPAMSDTSTSSVSQDTAAEEYPEPSLPEKDYDGYEFRIYDYVLGFGAFNIEHIVLEEENGDILNDAIYQRQRMVEEKFNIKFVEILASKDIKPANISTIVQAGDDEYDLIIASSQNMNLGIDYLVDFKTLDHINLDMPWWSQVYAEGMSVNGKLTAQVGSIMLTHMDSTLAMLFNKKLADDYKLPDLYEIVRDGSWTLSKFFELSKGATSDLDGNGEYNDSDRYAFVGLDGITRVAGVLLSGIVKDKNDIPHVDIDNAVLTDKMLKLKDFATTYERDIYDPRRDTNNGGDGDRAVFRLFMNDQALFYTHSVGSVNQFRDMKSDFGMIPPPKLDEKQENYEISHGNTKCMTIPITATDLDRTAIILEYMAYTGYDYLRPQYYDSMLQAKYLRDDESIEMMDKYIYPNVRFDLQYGQSKLSKAIRSICIGEGELASTFASGKSSYEADLKALTEMFDK